MKAAKNPAEAAKQAALTIIGSLQADQLSDDAWAIIAAAARNWQPPPPEPALGEIVKHELSLSKPLGYTWEERCQDAGEAAADVGAKRERALVRRTVLSELADSNARQRILATLDARDREARTKARNQEV
jgi:hypothetical protein